MRLSAFQLLVVAILVLGVLLEGSNAGPSAKVRRAPESIVDEETLYHYARGFLSRARSQESEEERTLEARGRSCHHDYECGFKKYCSTKRHRCYRKRRRGRICSRDGACRTGYCGRRTFKCSPKKTNGRICFHTNNACKSGYCDKNTNRCAAIQGLGGPCASDEGCRSGKCSDRGRCIPNNRPQPSYTPPPPVESGNN